MRKIITAIGVLLLLLTASYNEAEAQNVSTEGTDFWLTYLTHTTSVSGVRVSIYISAKDSISNGRIYIPGQGFSNFTISPNSTHTIELPVASTNSVSPALAGTPENKGIHITTEKNVSVYAVNRASQYSADATVVLPTNTLGTTYYATGYYAGTGASQAVVVALKDDTDIQISPTVTLSTGQTAGSSFVVRLDSGQTYMIQSLNNDITGTKFETVGSAAFDCKNYAVFSGSDRARVGGSCAASQDHLYQQMYPVDTWGQSFTFVPYQARSGGDIVKIVASEPNTTIQITGQPNRVLNEGGKVEIRLTNVSTISSDKPISVTQFATSADCAGGDGDPFMIGLSPNEQLLNQITFNAFPIFPSGFTYYVDMICPTAGIAGMKLDGADISRDFTVVPSNPLYSYAQIAGISEGNHTIVSDSGFIAYVYGFGSGDSDFESFGYATGASLENIEYNIAVLDTGILNVSTPDTVCINNFVQLSIDVDTSFYKFFQWDMGDGTIYNTKDVVHQYTESFDGFAKTYDIVFKANETLGDCGAELEVPDKVTVIKPDFTLFGNPKVCPNSSEILYSDSNVVAPHTYIWSIGGGTLVSGQGEDSILVDWGSTNPSAFIDVIVTNTTFGCTNTFSNPIVINDVLEPLVPRGEDSVCYSALRDKYETFFSNGNAYDWYAMGGTVEPDASNPNGNSTFITWDPDASEHFVWFDERNIMNTICEGTSDTLRVNVLPRITGTTTVVDVFCFGGSDGEASIAAAGGLDGIVGYEWLHDASLTTTSIGNLPAGIYQVEVTDGVGCTAIFTDTVKQPDPLVIDIVVDKEVCFGESDATITAKVSNGTRPYTYSWTGSSSTDSVATGLSGGTYSVTVTDGNGCPLTENGIEVIERPDVLFTVNAIDSACQFSTVEYIADQSEYAYTWVVTGGNIVSNNNDTITIEWGAVNAAGNINILAADTAGCNNQIDIPINIYDLEPAIPAGRDKVCLNDIGSVAYQAPLRAGYDYLWIVEGGSPVVNSTTNAINIAWNATATLHKLSYQLIAQNDAACNELSPELIIELQPELKANIAKKDVTCFGETDGWISLNTSGGVGSNYTFNWGHDNSLTQDSIASLASGIYTVTISDTAGCQIMESIEIIDPNAAITVQDVSITDADCFGVANGAIDVTIQGGTPNYSYQWDDASLPLSNQLSSISAGTYVLTVTDVNGCNLDTSIVVSQPDRYIFALQGEDSVCYGDVPTYTAVDSGYQSYTWSPTDGTVLSGQGTLQATIQWDSVQNHTLAIIIDNNGCLADTTVEVFSAFLEAELVATNPSCFGLSDGSVEAVVSGNSAVYNYDWNPTSSANIAQITDLPIGSYSVVITSLEGCEITKSAVLAQSELLVIDSLEAIDLTCHAEPTGEIEVAAQGGSAPYVFSWNDSSAQATPRAVSLLAGVYTVTVTDSLGCVADRTIEIIEPPVLETIFEATATVCDKKGGTASVDVSGATPPYSYEWLNATVNSSAMNQATGLLPDVNTVVITDRNDCVYAVNFNVPYKAPEIAFSNAFTPNGDGNNETFGPVITCNTPIKYEFKILDRWGNTMFYSETVGETWGGDANQTEMPSGIYPYYVYYLIELDGVVYEEKEFGSVLLIR